MVNLLVSNDNMNSSANNDHISSCDQPVSPTNDSAETRHCYVPVTSDKQLEIVLDVPENNEAAVSSHHVQTHQMVTSSKSGVLKHKVPYTGIVHHSPKPLDGLNIDSSSAQCTSTELSLRV